MTESLLRCRNPRDGTEIQVFRSGSGEPLLLVHGWTLDRHSFEPQLPLADDLQVLRYDRRGFGESALAHDLDGDLADIDAIVDALGGEPVHLLGVSQGARLAVRYAVSRPQKLRSLIVQGVIIDDFDAGAADDVPVPLEHYRALVEAGDVQQMRGEWLQHPLMNSETLTEADRQRLRDTVALYDGADLIGRGEDRDLAAPESMTSLEDLRKTSVPTLIITGERETAARKAHAKQLLSTLPDAREVILPDCGHLSNFSRPHAYNELVRRFLDEVRSRRGTRPEWSSPARDSAAAQSL